MVLSDNSRLAPDRRFRGRRGIALLSVLWVLTLLALMASTFNRTARTEIPAKLSVLLQEIEIFPSRGLIAQVGVNLKAR